MTDEVSQEEIARVFYDEGAGGEAAGLAYTRLMGTIWHHGDREVEKAGGTPVDAALAMQRRLTGLAGISAGDRVLDFGSGPGGATVAMAELTGATFVGVCNAETLNARARELAAERNLEERAAFVTIGDFDYRTFAAWPDASFDHAIFLESVCHIPDEHKPDIFRAFHRVLKPGGFLLGLDWVQRPFGDRQTPEQIDEIVAPICKYIRLGGLGTVESYAGMMTAAGFEVRHAEDEFAGEECWGSTPPEDRASWEQYDGPSGDVFQMGKKALDRGRGTGVFSVAWWAAQKTTSA